MPFCLLYAISICFYHFVMVESRMVYRMLELPVADSAALLCPRSIENIVCIHWQVTIIKILILNKFLILGFITPIQFAN